MLLSYLKLSPLVEQARINGRAILALESTVITHGLPYPQNLQTLAYLEELCRSLDVEPATIIVLDGIAHIGIGKEEILRLEKLTRDNTLNLLKLSMRDLPLALSQKSSGGTTVSATMQLANLAGIEVFATGGIGGVHRDWQSSPDISMDIHALASIPVAVVSAGAKAILDLGATLEALESSAVPVLGWQTKVFPTFYSRDSIYRIDSIANTSEFRDFFRLHQQLSGSPSGILIANPIPLDAEIKRDQVEPYISKAIEDAKQAGISGKALTPFLLDHLAKATKGESVKANLALLENNLRLGAALAKALLGD